MIANDYYIKPCDVVTVSGVFKKRTFREWVNRHPRQLLKMIVGKDCVAKNPGDQVEIKTVKALEVVWFDAQSFTEKVNISMGYNGNENITASESFSGNNTDYLAAKQKAIEQFKRKIAGIRPDKLLQLSIVRGAQYSGYVDIEIS